MDKKAWLDWAVGIGFLEMVDYEVGIEWQSEGDVLAFQFHGKTTQIRSILEFAIRDEIDKRNWFVSQFDAKVYSDRECTQYEGKEYHVIISKLVGVLGKGESKDSRLEALMQAFKLACEAE